MESHKKTVSYDNGIIEIKQSNEFSCLICNINGSGNDWRKHKASASHIVTLERFNLMFTECKDGIMCKVCEEFLSWETLITHAYWHKMVPWYKPTNQYKTFFRNRVIEWESQFYCYPCDEFFPEWSTAYIHLMDKRHQNLLKNATMVNDLSSWSATPVPYDILVSEGFVSNTKTMMVKCTICDCWNISLKNVPEHVRGQQHLHMKVKFVESLRLMKKKISNGSRNSNNALNLFNVNNPSIYIVERAKNEYSCEICDLKFFDRKDADLHINEACHVDALKKYGYEQIWLKEQNDTYNCKCCDCSVFGIKNVHRHVRGVRHRDSLSESKSSSAENGVDLNNSALVQDEVAKPGRLIDSSSSFLPVSHIEKLNTGEFLCNLCNVFIQNATNIQNHIAGKNHVLGIQQLAENIVFKKGNNYHCVRCNCMIPGLENVYRHINGYRHEKSLSALEQHMPKSNIKNSGRTETSKRPENVPKPDSLFLPDRYIEKLNSTELICNLCNIIIPSVANIRNHLTGKSHAFGVKQLAENIVLKGDNNYHCKCCNCSILGLNNVYSHINGNIHARSLEAGSRNSVQIVTPKSADTDSDLSLIPNHDSLPEDHMENRSNIKSHSNEFDESISGELKFQRHTTGPDYVMEAKQSSENIFIKEHDNYHCKCCNCTLSSINELYVHLNSDRHEEFFSVFKNPESMVKERNSDQVETAKHAESAIETSPVKSDAMLTEDHIANRDITESLHKRCDETVSGEVDVHKHLTDLNGIFDEKLLFVNIFFKGNNSYHCKCCDCSISGFNDLYLHLKSSSHAKSLSALEQHESKTSTKNSDHVQASTASKSAMKTSFLKNDSMVPKGHIEKRNNTESHYKLCDETISRESNIQNDLTGTNHVLGENQLSENISHKGSNNYHCNLRHDHGNRHAKSISGMEHGKQEAQNKSAAKVEIPKQSESSTKSPCIENNLMFPKNHIEKQNGKESKCRLCNETFSSDSNIEKHVGSKAHLSNARKLSENITFVADNNFQCKCCDCIIPGIENIYRHINGIRHAEILGNFGQQEKNVICKKIAEIKQPEKIAGKKSHEKCLSYNHIFRSTRTTFCCKICNSKDIASSNVDDHVAGRQHVESLKIFSDAITIMKSDKNYCKLCKSTIDGMDNVYTHLQGFRHKTLSNKANKTKIRETASSFDYNAFLAELEKNMKESKPKSLIPQVDSPQKNIPCAFCDFSLPLTSDRHSHLAIHIGAEFSALEDLDNIKETTEDVSASEQNVQNGNLSQLVTKPRELKRTELANHNPKVSSNSLRSEKTKSLSNHTNFSNSVCAELVPAKPTTNLEAAVPTPKKSSMQKIAELLNPKNDFIYDMRDKLRDMERGMKLCSIKDMNNIYCLICKKEVPETMQNYSKHLNSTDHCEYLEEMEKDHALFELFPGQFSEFDLVCQYMEEVSDFTVHCHACDTDIDNNDMKLRVHINDQKHKESRQKMHLSAKRNFDEIKSLLSCDWYTIYKYWCVPCSEYFESEFIFAKHLRSTGHAIVIQQSINCERALIHDFCSLCGILWFGFRCTYANHCKSEDHESATWKKKYRPLKLGKIVTILLINMEQYIDCTIKHFDRLSVTERDKEETLIRDLEMAVKSKFFNAKAFVFGSKASGFRRGDSDIEIFLDCDNTYDGAKSLNYGTLYLMTTVHECLCKDRESWCVNEMFTVCRSSNLKVRHYATGLTCQIYFENEFAVKNMKLIEYFNDIFPPCRKMIFFLHQWLSFCGLSEPGGISNNALYWYMIFYLQKESSLPSVGSLNTIKNRFVPIAGWEIDESFDFSRNEAKRSSLSIKELLINFFTFYTKFDYRYYAVSPFLGQEIEKRRFADPTSLPEEMASYIDYVKNSNDPRSFRIDTAMCLQDPLILQRNLTEDVSKAYLSRFRAYCVKSSDVLRSAIIRI